MRSTLTRASRWLQKRAQPARRLPSPAKERARGIPQRGPTKHNLLPHRGNWRICMRSNFELGLVSTDFIDQGIRDHVASLYEVTGGLEMVVLDCIGFLRHFLHLFHRIRVEFLDAYQALVLNEPESAVNQPLKEAFLSLRQAAIAAE